MAEQDKSFDSDTRASGPESKSGPDAGTAATPLRPGLGVIDGTLPRQMSAEERIARRAAALELQEQRQRIHAEHQEKRAAEERRLAAAAEERRLAAAAEERRQREAREAENTAQARAQLRPVVGSARPRTRHYVIVASFIVLVLAPLGTAAWYLWERAVDQYASHVAFSIRKEDSSSVSSMLGNFGGFAQIGGGGASDSEILYQYLQSQDLVARLDEAVDLRGLYSRYYETDPLFGFDPSGSIEDLVAYWNRVLHIAYDDGTGIIKLRVNAFAPQEAQLVAEQVLEESRILINDLSAIARADATRYAREELDTAVDRLKTAREAITAYRLETRLIDPTADIQSQMGVLAGLQQELANALVELDLLRQTAGSSDPRIANAELRVAAIEARIADERNKFGAGGQGPEGADYATILGEFERLTVDQLFAEESYRLALASYDVALAQAQRTSRYIAAHVQPTLAESTRYPERGKILALIGLFLVLVWALAVLIFYSLRDRR